MGFLLPDYSKCFFTAGYVFSSCSVVYAAALVWMADQRSINCDNLYFYADCIFKGDFGWFLSADHA